MNIAISDLMHASRGEKGQVRNPLRGWTQYEEIIRTENFTDRVLVQVREQRAVDCAHNPIVRIVLRFGRLDQLPFVELITELFGFLESIELLNRHRRFRDHDPIIRAESRDC